MARSSGGKCALLFLWSSSHFWEARASSCCGWALLTCSSASALNRRITSKAFL